MEDSDNQTRHNTNAVVSEQDLADTYLPAFISCANRGNASGMMCSHVNTFCFPQFLPKIKLALPKTTLTL